MSQALLVVKFGGALAQSPVALESVLRQLHQLQQEGASVVVVHGGGKQIRALNERFGIVEQFHNGLRITDAAALELVQIGLSQVNRALVHAARMCGLNAVGLTGLDGGSFRAERLPIGKDGIDYGFVGKVTASDPQLLRHLILGGYTPLVACLAAGTTEPALNVNGDEMAAAVATVMQASKLIFLTDVAGILDGSGQVIGEIALERLRALRDAGTISGGMIPKSRACEAALSGGVGEVHIVGFATPQALLKIARGEGCGTKLRY